MKRSHVSVIVMTLVVSGGALRCSSCFAAEHGGSTVAPAGKEHGGTMTPAPAGKEHGGTTQEHGGQAATTEPSAEQIRQAIEDHIKGTVAKEGAFTIKDEVTGATRTLELVRVHERVGKTGELYYSCTDMRDTATSELLDLDFDVKAEGGALSVVDQRIHKVNNQPRYTYDEHDNRIPATSKSSEPAPEREQTE